MVVAIAPMMSGITARLAHNTAQRFRIGSRGSTIANRRRNGLKVRACANKLINLLAGGLGTVGFAHGFQGQLNTAESDALKVVVFASCAARAIPGRASAMFCQRSPSIARKPPSDHHRTGDGEIRFMGRAGGPTQPVPQSAPDAWPAAGIPAGRRASPHRW